MPISHGLKCIFVHIPRTGGTSIEAALGILGDWRLENSDLMFGRIDAPRLKRQVQTTAYLQHLTAEQLRLLTPGPFERYFRFAFVRNPWDRMVSIYCYKMRAEGLSFDEFLEETNNRDDAWHMPQSRLITDGGGEQLVDFVGRFERLHDDFRHVCQTLAIDRPLPHLNHRIHGDYRGYYDAQSRAVVTRRFRDDIERFGYSF